MEDGSKTKVGILAICLFNVIVHLALFDKLEFHRDELLYFSIGLHPQFGYASIPPLTGWIAAGLQFLFGYSLFAVKVFPAVLSGLFTYVSISITKELGGKDYAQILTGIAILVMPVTIRAFHLFQPVCIDLFLWTLILYYSLRFINTEKDKFLILIGLTAGFGLLNKYLILLLLVSIIVSIAFSMHRKIFTNKAFYFGMGVCMLVFSPNLIWQIVHGLPVINHMSELNETQLVNVSRIDFVKDQFMMTMASSFLAVIGFVKLLKSRKYRYLALCTIFVYAILLVLRGKSYYSIGMIPMLVAAGAVSIESFSLHKSVKFLLPVVMIVLIIPLFPLGIPIYKQEGMVEYFQMLEEDYGLIIGRRFEDGTIHSLPQDYADQLGWEELTQVTAEAFGQVNDKKRTMIYCENYGQAGAIAVIGKKYNLPEPVSFSDSFIYWIPHQFEQEIESFIYINDELGEDVEELFQNIQLVGQITNPNAREFGTSVFLCTNPKYAFSEFWEVVLQRVLND